jgi:hypothetical protein
MSDLMSIVETIDTKRAMEGFASLMAHVCELYTCGESSSVSEFEGRELAESVLYVLGLTDETVQQTINLLSSEDVVTIWTIKRNELESRIPDVIALWQRVVSVMPPIRNIALRDTLASIGKLPKVYDTFFAAHEVPASIDYPLSVPVPECLKGLDYVEAWLTRLLEEARFLALFDENEISAYLDAWCPDYRGLLINLHDPIHEAWRKGRISPRREPDDIPE